MAQSPFHVPYGANPYSLPIKTQTNATTQTFPTLHRAPSPGTHMESAPSESLGNGPYNPFQSTLAIDSPNQGFMGPFNGAPPSMPHTVHQLPYAGHSAASSHHQAHLEPLYGHHYAHNVSPVPQNPDLFYPTITGPPSSSSAPSAPPSGDYTLRQHRAKAKYPLVDPTAKYSLIAGFPLKPWSYGNFNAELWLKTFHSYASQVKKRFDLPSQCCRTMRIHVMSDTVEACARGSIPGPGGSQFANLLDGTLTSPSIQMSDEILKSQAKLMKPHRYPKIENQLMVVNGDSLDVGLICASFGLKTCVLSLGNATRRGGGWQSGAAAQEESLFRRTNLYRILCDPREVMAVEAKIVGENFHSQSWLESNTFGPLEQADTIYTADAVVFRESEFRGYAYMEEPAKIDILTACALQRHHATPLSPNEKSQTLKTIRNILGRAILEGCDAIVLGALGCGAFHNPPAEIAELFHHALFDNGYLGMLRFVAFAIIEDQNSANGNLKPFCRQFDSYASKRTLHSLSTLSSTLETSLKDHPVHRAHQSESGT